MYRYFNSQFWTDPFVEELTPSQKLIYIYLFTSCPTQAGIYEISARRISNETGVERDEVLKTLKILEENKKIYKIGNYILLVNFLKYQATRSPKIIKKIEKELQAIQYKTNIIKIFKEKIWAIHMEIKGIEFPLDMSLVKKFEPEEFHDEENSETKKDMPDEVSKSSTQSSTQNCPVQKIVDLWNSYVTKNNSELKPVKKVSSGTKRHRHLVARWRENPSLGDWERVFNNATLSDFLNGRVTGKSFFASFDWIIQSADNFNKVWEGQYNASNRDNTTTMVNVNDKQHSTDLEWKIGKAGIKNLTILDRYIGEENASQG